MTQPTTLGDLRARTLDYADLTGSEFPEVDRLDNYINVGLGKLHDLLINAYQDYYRQTQTLTLVSGQEEYDLPDDFYKSLELYYRVGDRYYGIPKFEKGALNGYRQGSLVAGTVTHWYAPQVARLTLETDKMDLTVPFTWEDYVALTAAVRLLIKEESDPSGLMALQQQEYQRITDMAEPRDEGDQGKVEDVYNRFNHAADHYREWRYLRYRIMGRKIHFFEFEYLGT